MPLSLISTSTFFLNPCGFYTHGPKLMWSGLIGFSKLSRCEWIVVPSNFGCVRAGLRSSTPWPFSTSREHWKRARWISVLVSHQMQCCQSQNIVLFSTSYFKLSETTLNSIGEIQRDVQFRCYYKVFPLGAHLSTSFWRSFCGYLKDHSLLSIK